MKNFSDIKSLIGETVTENDLKNVDCYVYKNVGLFIPSTGQCGFAAKSNHAHPSYMIIIDFSKNSSNTPSISFNHYLASISSPNIPHNDIYIECPNYYCILIDKQYFESQFSLYTNQQPHFEFKNFEICSDILKALNMFALEYGKNMKNSDITLYAQATIITHWIIRSILGENLDMRSISSNYEIGYAQQYISAHFNENITVGTLTNLIHMSNSSFHRLFKKETGISPLEYIIQVRIEKSKNLLKRNDIPITDIALRCGFSGSAHFSSCFKRIMHVSPTYYRNSYKD